MDGQAGGDEPDHARCDLGRRHRGHVHAHEADRRHRQHVLGRGRIDGGEDVAHREEPVDRGDDLVVRGLDRLELHDDAIGGDRQQVHAQQQRRADGQISGVMRRDEVEVDVGERLQERPRAVARRRGRRIGIARQDLVSDDGPGRVADRLADSDDPGRGRLFGARDGPQAHPRDRRPQRPGVDLSAATLNAWAFSTVR